MEALTYARVRQEMEPLDGYRRVTLHHSTHPKFEVDPGGAISVSLPQDPTDGDTEHDRYVVTREMWDGLAKDLGAGGRYFDRTPPRLLLPQLNFWYGDRDAEKPAVDMLVRDAPNGSTLALDILRQGKHPVGATQLLDIVHGAISDKGGEPNYAFFDRDGLREVTLACVQPNAQHEVQSLRPGREERRVGDILERGVLVRFSPIGAIPVTVQSYINRLVCTNGMSITETLDQWSAPGGEGSNDPYEWLPSAIDLAWTGNQSMIEAADRLAQTPVPEEAIETITDDLFDTFRIPQSMRSAVIRRLAAQNVETMWDISNAITHAATHDESLRRARDRVRLMTLGGDLAGHTERCEHCNHLIHR